MSGYHKQALRIAFVYVALGLLWIYFSTIVLNSRFEDEVSRHLNRMQVLIRSSFILFSAIVLYFFIHRYHAKLVKGFEEYQALFENNPNAMWIYDLSTLKFLAVNEAAIFHYGYSHEEFLSMSIKDIRPREDLPRLEKAFTTIKKGFYTSGTWRHIKKNGEVIFVEIFSTPVMWKGHKAELILAHDISLRIQYENDLRELNENLELKIVERTKKLDEANRDLLTLNEELVTSNEEMTSTNEELHSTNEQLVLAQRRVEEQAKQLVSQSEEKLNKIMATLKDVVWSGRYNEKGELCIDFMNQAAEVIYGYKVEEFLNDTNVLRNSIYEDDKGLVLRVKKDLEESSFSQVEHRIRTKHGAIKWINARIWIIRDENNKPLRIDGIITDITSQKQIEIELHQQREMLQKLVDSLPLSVVLLDHKLKVMFVNKNCEHTLGWTLEEAVGKNMMAELYPDKMQQRKLFEFLKEEGKWIDFKTTTKAGTIIDTSWTNIVLSDGSIIGIGQDITERKKKEDEVNNLLEQLIDQNNNLLQFSFIASHNLRGPVATVLGLLRLSDREEMSPFLKDLFGMLNRSVHKLDEVIRDLTKVLEIRSNTSQPKEWIDLVEMMDNFEQTFRSQLVANRVEIKTDFSAVHFFFTIRSYFQSILSNLIMNSIKYRASNKMPVIEIKTFRNEGYVGFTVSDNGMGIDLELFRSKMFTLYQRFHTHVEGKGLGLFLTKTQTEVLGGTIDVESTPGEGTTFTIRFPAEIEEPVL
ncbi:MAG: PAS domain S-box protein [Bacteroidota bacterium]